jgi:beta-RFAP synthase
MFARHRERNHYLQRGQTPPIENLALLTGRGGTSGIGVHVFDLGGFIVDGGHRWPEDKCELGPTRHLTELG